MDGFIDGFCQENCLFQLSQSLKGNQNGRTNEKEHRI